MTTEEDPLGYRALRADVKRFSAGLREQGLQQSAAALEHADRFLGADFAGGQPSEWLGEIALALEAALDSGEVSVGLRRRMSARLTEIQDAFQRGSGPSF